jgi:putative ABC transport system permease protein
VLGVSMVSGTYVLTDTISRALDGFFSESYEGTDVVVNRRDRPARRASRLNVLHALRYE